jgi:hypothetical protein
MALSDDTRRALLAYDSFTDFACCPDLLWSPPAYERLEDDVAQHMLRALCYVWAASQQAAKVYHGPADELADRLCDALPTWDAQWPHQRKVEWTLSLGLDCVLFQTDQRPPTPPEPAGLSCAELDAVDDMASYFQIERTQATLLFQLGRALGKPMPDIQAQVGGQTV